MGKMSVSCQCAYDVYIWRELEVALLKLNLCFVETLLYSQAS